MKTVAALQREIGARKAAIASGARSLLAYSNAKALPIEEVRELMRFL
jgi:hypothetical protein